MKKTLFAFGIPRSGGASGYWSATPRAALDAARTTTNTEGSADA